MKTGFACGMFDLFHAGHVLMLQECKKNCDYLIVAINTAENISKEINPVKNKPIFSLEERKLIVESSKYVDEVLIYNSEEELYNILRTNKIDIRFLGDDYRGKEITGSDLNIQNYFVDRSHGYSTTATINRILNRYKK